MNFDLDALEQSTRNTIDVSLGHQTKLDKDGNTVKGDPVGFKVLGPCSDEYREADRAIQVLNIKEAAIRKAAVDLETDEGATVVVEGGDNRRKLLIDKCVVGWFGFTDKGKPAEFSKENVARALKARPMWARRLVAAIEDESAFIGG
jgi:hypothetical protein